MQSDPRLEGGVSGDECLEAFVLPHHPSVGGGSKKMKLIWPDKKKLVQCIDAYREIQDFRQE